VRDVALVAREALEAVGLTGWPKTSGSRGIHINVRIERRWTYDEVRRAALALARDVERRAPHLATSKWWKEERHGVFLDYNQNAKDRTVASAYSVRPTPDARVSMPLDWSEVADVVAEDFTLATVPALVAVATEAPASMARGSLDALLELSAATRPETGGCALAAALPKAGGEPRVQPSSGARRQAGPRHRPAGGLPPGSGGSPSGRGGSPSGRRQSTKPLIEIARAAKQADALAGLDRWKARHPDAAAHLAPADVLVDAMRGRYTTWTRIRVNLEHVPAADRPSQEPIDPDYDPWAEYRQAGSSS
jgi:hypothetical protein